MEELSDRVAVVTGAASGIGAALVDELVAEGMKVVMADIETDALDAAVARVRGDGGDVVGVRCDVSERDQVEALAASAVERYGAVHLVANNAGVAIGGPSWEISRADWEWVLGVDLWGVIHGVSVFTPLIIEAGGGHIVNTASMAGLTSTPFMAPYNVAKHGVVTLSETLFTELSLTHPEVGVTVVCPGWVRTGINRSERNRPGGEVEPEAADEAADDRLALRGLVDDLIGQGLEPSDVARRIVAAVRSGTFWVLTHTEWSAMVARRTDNILAGRAPEFVLPPND
jgi:NAD(P)-dependent dehydrogenase (short-subunit alcohol dehydrogenase family)